MGAGAKKLGAMAVVLSVLAAVVGGCHSAPPGQAPPAAQSSLSDVPPPLVPAMDLPANAVDNAVSKLDDMADELMKKSGIPGMAVAVVHGGKTVYAKGFGVKDVRSGDKVDPDTVLEDLGYERQYVLERLRQLVYA
jgi:CubicO group peptidase (beta-lactamase class C family)